MPIVFKKGGKNFNLLNLSNEEKKEIKKLRCDIFAEIVDEQQFRDVEIGKTKLSPSYKLSIRKEKFMRYAYNFDLQNAQIALEKYRSTCIDFDFEVLSVVGTDAQINLDGKQNVNNENAYKKMVEQIKLSLENFDNILFTMKTYGIG